MRNQLHRHRGSHALAGLLAACLLMPLVLAAGCEDDDDIGDAARDAADEIGDAADDLADEIDDTIDNLNDPSNDSVEPPPPSGS